MTVRIHRISACVSVSASISGSKVTRILEYERGLREGNTRAATVLAYFPYTVGRLRCRITSARATKFDGAGQCPHSSIPCERIALHDDFNPCTNDFATSPALHSRAHTNSFDDFTRAPHPIPALRDVLGPPRARMRRLVDRALSWR